MFQNISKSRPQQFGFIIFSFFLFIYFLYLIMRKNLLWRLPPLLKDIPLMINNLLDNLMFNWFKIQVWDPDWEMYEEKTLFRQITRGIASGVLFFIIFIREVFLGGIQTISAITGDGLGKLLNGFIYLHCRGLLLSLELLLLDINFREFI